MYKVTQIIIHLLTWLTNTKRLVKLMVENLLFNGQASESWVKIVYLHAENMF